jgi:hypothetical protein
MVDDPIKNLITGGPTERLGHHLRIDPNGLLIVIKQLIYV